MHNDMAMCVRFPNVGGICEMKKSPFVVDCSCMYPVLLTYYAYAEVKIGDAVQEIILLYTVV